MKTLSNKCVTCRHWTGDKEKALDDYAEDEISISIDDGWPRDGRCKLQYKWADIEIYGDASVHLSVPSGFGCVLHEADEARS